MSRVLLLATVAVLAVGLVVVAAGSAGDAPDVRTAKAAGEEREERAPAAPTDGPFALAATRPESPTQRDVPRTDDRPRATHEVGGAVVGGRPRGQVRRSGYRAYFLDDLARRLEVTNVEIRRGITNAFASLRDDARPIDPRTATAEELAVLKRRLAARLGEELKIQAPAIVEAVRAEMIDSLRWAVRSGAISKEARARVVDCFDDPAACDVELLRASLPNGL